MKAKQTNNNNHPVTRMSEKELNGERVEGEVGGGRTALPSQNAL